MALVLRIQKTAGGIIAARNAAARLCKLGSFIATGVGPRQPNPSCYLKFLLLQVQCFPKMCQQQYILLRLRPKDLSSKRFGRL